MIKTYEDILPKDHFDNLYERTIKHLARGENVLVSAIYGCGSTIFLNLFLRLIKEDNIFQEIIIFDPISQKIPLIKLVSKLQKDNNKQKLLIIRLFESLQVKRDILESLHSIKQENPKNITYLVFSNHDGYLNSEIYSGITTPFFNGRFYIGPFDLEETKKLMKINSDFFGWNTPTDLYKKIYELSGGIPRIIKHIAREIYENRNDINDIDWFMKSPSIKFQLENLSKIFRQYRISEAIRLGLIGNNKKIKSSLLEKYLEEYKSEIVLSLYPTLPKLESKLLSLLYENKNTIVSIDQIGDFMELNGREFSPWAIYKLMSRLKTKIKTNFEIENLKGRGYILRLLGV